MILSTHNLTTQNAVTVKNITFGQNTEGVYIGLTNCLIIQVEQVLRHKMLETHC